MGKLRAIGARVQRLPPRMQPMADHEGHARSDPSRSWYKLARWARLRLRVFLRDGYVCQMSDCGQVTAAPIADHVKPHRGNPALFWNEKNVQTLCKPCHDSRKQAAEHRERMGGGSKL